MLAAYYVKFSHYSSISFAIIYGVMVWHWMAYFMLMCHYSLRNYSLTSHTLFAECRPSQSFSEPMFHQSSTLTGRAGQRLILAHRSRGRGWTDTACMQTATLSYQQLLQDTPTRV